MTRTAICLTLVAAAAAAAGCASPALVAGQRRTLQAMVQYRGEMAAYHGRMQAHLLAEKEAQLDAALAESLSRAADAEGNVPLGAALEKVRKRQDLEGTFRANLALLHEQFQARQAAFGRAIDLAAETLDLAEAYGRLPALVRSLAVREIEAEQLTKEYDYTRSDDHAGSRDEPETGGR